MSPPLRHTLQAKASSVLSDVYASSTIYKQTVDELSERVRALSSATGANSLVQVETKDFYFVPLVAEKVGLPLHSVFKDEQIWHEGKQVVAKDTTIRAVHVTDLVREGSTFSTTLKPAMTAIGGIVVGTACIVYRKEGVSSN